MNTKQFLAAILLTGGMAGYGTAQVADPATMPGDTTTASTGAMNSSEPVSSETQTFMEKAATGGMMEVQLGQMAQEQASASEVKNFGQRMVTDHSKANEELKSLAQQKGVTLPDSLTNKQMKKVEKLSQLSGEAFDEAYMDMMVKDHQKDVKTYDKASQNVPDPAVQDFASQTLPTLKEHLQKAEEINQQMRNS